MSRWRPPHPDPGTAPTPSRQPRGPGLCRWPKCTGRPSTRYDVHLCDDHAIHIWATVNGGIKTAEMRKTAAAEAAAHARDEAAAKLDAGQDLDRTDPVPGWIYYLRVGDTIKIGYARSVYNRLRQYPPNAVLLAVEPGTPKIERARHSLFHAHLAAGREWFHPNAELDTWIDQIRQKHGDPDGHRYTFTQPLEQQPPVVAGKRRNRRW